MKSFKEQAERWKRENTNPGGGIVVRAKGARYDDHSDTAEKLREMERQFGRPSSSAGHCNSSGVSNSREK
jgi:hypothetical protein